MITHGDYLNEPAETVAWLLAIDSMKREVEADQHKREEEAILRANRRR